jgi:hypothetical protein
MFLRTKIKAEKLFESSENIPNLGSVSSRMTCELSYFCPPPPPSGVPMCRHLFLPTLLESETNRGICRNGFFWGGLHNHIHMQNSVPMGCTFANVYAFGALQRIAVSAYASQIFAPYLPMHGTLSCVQGSRGGGSRGGCLWPRRPHPHAAALGRPRPGGHRLFPPRRPATVGARTECMRSFDAFTTPSRRLP